MSICRNCSTEYTPSKANRNTEFCGKACYQEYRIGNSHLYNPKSGKVITCEFCGKEMYKKPSEIHEHNYCSRHCANKAHSKAIVENPQLKTHKGTEVICQNCSKPFYVKPFRVATAKFCSRVCSSSARFGVEFEHKKHKDIKGKNNPNYRNSNNSVTARLIALANYKKACLICGWDVYVDVHHIIPRSLGGSNDITNLIVLCPNHHKMADLKLISREELTKLVTAAIAQQSGRQLLFDLP